MNNNGAPDRPSWQAELEEHVGRLSDEERDLLRARSLRALDRASAAHPLSLDELSRLSALAEYLSERIGRRSGLPPPALNEAVMFGLMAGFQLHAGDDIAAKPDPFDT